MKKKPEPYNIYHYASAVIMMVALFWLTISAPFIYASQQQLAKCSQITNLADSPEEEETAGTFGNTTEEKKPNSGNSFSEEYLHNHHTDDLFISTISQFHKCENAGVYNAFHGEVHVPPPNLA